MTIGPFRPFFGLVSSEHIGATNISMPNRPSPRSKRMGFFGGLTGRLAVGRVVFTAYCERASERNYKGGNSLGRRLTRWASPFVQWTDDDT
jgi:hypothetical protein